MLFGVTRGELAGLFGEDRLTTLPATAFPPAVADTEGARLLRTVGVPTGVVTLYRPGGESGRLSLVRETVHLEDFEDAPEGAGEWPVIGWLLNAHLALDPGSGKVFAFDSDEETAQALHTDVSSLVQVAARIQRLLEEFTFDGDQETGFALLEHEVERIRQETGDVDPLPFHDDETVWSVIGDEIAMGQRFTAGSPGGRALYG
ncbi:SUKH-4 family immunity protein [Streptomyces fragilis]|uniref:SUKH-4 family immunity protein n=1 Tax=Streptomyces fragilis TaxID=67301 RepID=A0ABV2YFQ0_9ACTN|nr:SUKH-4 family immunity protein [Streptomyces fragilis]